MASINGLRHFMRHPNKIFGYLARKNLLNWIPDKPFLEISYRMNMGKKLDLRNPQTFNEKLQWLKLYDRKPIYTTMVDKYEAKKYVAGIIGEEYIIPTLGIWDRFEDIDFGILPNQFVLKCTHDSGGLVICRDKNKLDLDAAKAKMNRSLSRNYYWGSREWPYKNVKPRIIAEKYMSDEKQESLVDYKFFCFNGELKMLYISEGLEDHSTAHMSFFDLDGNEMPFHRSDYNPIEYNIVLPDNFDKMKVAAVALAKNVNNAFVRIDLYSIGREVYFSEITFSPCGGMLPFDPPKWDRILGDWITLQKEES